MNTILPYQQRVMVEKLELDEKIKLLEAFILSDKFLEVSDEEMNLLTNQKWLMKNYSKILELRIKNFNLGKQNEQTQSDPQVRET